MGPKEDIKLIVDGLHGDPFSVLGMHVVGEGTKRALRSGPSFRRPPRPGSSMNGRRRPMRWRRCIRRVSIPSICLERHFPTVSGWRLLKERYRRSSTLTPLARSSRDYDLHLIGEGSHYKKYEKLGAHVIRSAG